MLISLALSLAMASALSFVSYRWLTPKWIAEVRAKWSTINVSAAAFAVLAAGVASVANNDSFDYRVASILLVAWLLVVICFTDYSAYKIPRGASRMAIAVSAGLLVWGMIDNHSISEYLAVTGVALIVPLLFFMVQGIGMGDIRLFVILALSLTWWVTLSGWFNALGIAAFIGIISFALAKIMSRGEHVDFTKSRIRSAISKNGAENVSKKVIPFGPALAAAYFGYAMFSIISQGGNMPVSVL